MSEQAKRAFPNAYIDTDQPPRKSAVKGALALVGAAGAAYFGLTILVLSLISTDYSPMSQFASDYGVGRYAAEMNLGFLVGGVGMISFSLANAAKMPNRAARFGSALVFMAGVALMVDSYFTTDIEGASATLHGTIHGFGGLVFFFLAPVGLLAIYSRLGRGRLLAVLGGLAVGATFEVTNSVLSWGAAGLAERILILVIFSSVVAASLSLYRTSADG